MTDFDFPGLPPDVEELLGGILAEFEATGRIAPRPQCRGLFVRLLNRLVAGPDIAIAVYCAHMDRAYFEQEKRTGHRPESGLISEELPDELAEVILNRGFDALADDVLIDFLVNPRRLMESHLFVNDLSPPEFRGNWYGATKLEG